MKHAGDACLDALEPLLKEMRAFSGISEKKRGVFYRGSKAFLHFHEDPEGFFADLRFAPSGDFDRYRVSTAAEQKRFTQIVRAGLK